MKNLLTGLLLIFVLLLIGCETKTVKIEFMVDDDVYEVIHVKPGESYQEPQVPVKEGYTFIGWDRKDSSFTTNTVIKAMFKINEFTVTFLDGETVLQTSKVNYMENATPPNNPIKEGHTFIGWDGSYIGVKQDVNIQTIYEIKSYQVTFLDGKEVLQTSIVNYLEDAIPPTAPQREGHTFLGWSDSYEGITSDVNLVAIYEKNQYQVTFMIDNEVVYEDLILHGNVPTPPLTDKEHYTFSGWDIDVSLPITKNTVFNGTYERITLIDKYLDFDDTLLGEFSYFSGDPKNYEIPATMSIC